MNKAYHKALRWLNRRDYSQVELESKLHREQMSSVDIQQTVSKLIDLGLLNDKRYAECFIRAKTSSGYGPLWIRQALRAKGIHGEYEHFFAEYDYYTQATKLIMKRCKVSTQTRQQYHFLQRRGFSHDIITAVLNSLEKKQSRN